MEDYEYEEENLDDFMINASSIISEDNNPEKETMIESLKQHLMSIFNNQSEMQNFFNTLNSVIFSQNSNKIIHKQVFKIYPIVFSFNPNACFYYIDLFLSAINQSVNEENREFFAYLSSIFSEVILSFFSDEKGNKHLIQNNFLLDNNKKNKLYEKFINFCYEKLKINKKTEQSFGCLLLTELIEKCPLIKEEKILDNLFKIISSYLEDKWFICKLDLLNCTISLIFTAETRFKPYANICLFRVLDYLTDSEWMKRKLAINIVYTLVFYCKEEIMAVKDNIVEFLYTLKDDPVQEVREVCIQTLRFIEETEALENEKDNSQRAEPGYPKKKKNVNKKQNTNDYLKENNKNNINQNPKKNLNKKSGGYNKSTNNINKRSNNDKSEDKINNTNNNTKTNLTEDNSKSMSNFDNYNSRSQYKIIDKQKYNEDYLRRQLLKEKRYLERQERELNELTKKNNLTYNNNLYQPKLYRPKKKNKNVSKLNKDNSNLQSSKQKEKLNNNDYKNDNTINKDHSPQNKNEINENGNDNYNNINDNNYVNNYENNNDKNNDNNNDNNNDYNYEKNNDNNNNNNDNNYDNNNYDNNNYDNNNYDNNNYDNNNYDNNNNNNDNNNVNNNVDDNNDTNENNDDVNYNDNNEKNDNDDNYNSNDDNNNDNNNNNQNINDNINNNDNVNDNTNNNYTNNNINNGPYQNTLNGIFQQLNTIQEGQTRFMAKIKELQKTIEDNYTELNGRISALEDHFSSNHIY